MSLEEQSVGAGSEIQLSDAIQKMNEIDLKASVMMLGKALLYHNNS
jgi:UTP-glucose-1-phosphate uridylyltransferase